MGKEGRTTKRQILASERREEMEYGKKCRKNINLGEASATSSSSSGSEISVRASSCGN